MINLVRQKALQLGQKTFFTGIPCKNGHIAERNTKRYKCVQCKREWNHSGG